MKVAQQRGIEAERRVLGNIAPGTEGLALAFDEHAARAGVVLDAIEHRAQLAPHGTRHGIEPPRVTQHHTHHTGLRAPFFHRDHFTCHG